ncbi:MAG: hypothetical protein IMX04_02265 [Candidatus Carbobacillus altaicus]|uniref:Uncharacterized protein n=1 Tax=Candidatus Carbonibacillus altaicus TaxID=2163959 RepID=A0A2R6Y4U1_9BACL|nr:hypothetical protein [Candidatus Carbobacillus altaicus]PTQ57700.1 MAG: hypothetical protein BSOLF_0895 [Candidatus Carbobacillus altaicus]
MNLKLIELQVAIPRSVDLGIEQGARSFQQAHLAAAHSDAEQRRIDRAKKRPEHADPTFSAKDDPLRRGRRFDKRL